MDNYFMSPESPQAQQIMAQASQKPKKKSPEETLAEVQVQQIQSEMQSQMMKLQLDREKMFMEDERKRDELDAKLTLDAIELQAKYGTQINVA